MIDLGATVDPGLSQQLLARTGSTIVPEAHEAHADDVVPVIGRLDPSGSVVPGLRVISRFGGVVTARVRLGDLTTVRNHPAVRSLKAIRTYGPALATTVRDVGAAASQLPRHPNGTPLTGSGVLVAVLDWGLDVTHANLRNADHRTAIEALWDQRGGRTPSSPEPFGYGRVLARAQIDAALTASDPHAQLQYDHADVDPTGEGTHGTHVADIAVGRGRAPGSAPGVAPGASLAFIHLRGEDTGPEDTLGDSARILEGCDWAMRLAAGRPLVIHMSLGRTGGPHDDTLLVTRALDHLLAARSGVAVVMSCGNYYDSRLHASLGLQSGETVTLPWDVPAPAPGGTELELWYHERDRIAAALIAPDGRTILELEPGSHAVHRTDQAVVASGFSRLRDPNSADNVIDIFLQPGAPAGRWTIRLSARTVHDGRVEAWIERTASRYQARFPAEVANPASTTGSICNGLLPLSVGAYDASTPERAPMAFSSEGPSRDGRPKPDVSAPGGRVLAAQSSVKVDGQRVRDCLVRKSGTSMAAPHVTGTIALMFEATLPRRLPMAVTRWLLLENTRVPSQPDGRYGAGLLDAAAACRAAIDLSQRSMRTPAPNTRLATQVDASAATPGGIMTLTASPHDRVFSWLTGEDVSQTEAALGTLTLHGPNGGSTTSPVDTRAPVRTATDADAAVIEALTDRAGHQVISATDGGWEIAPFGPPMTWLTTSVAEFDAPGLHILTVNGGERVYVPVDPSSPGNRRVDVPGLRSFYGLPLIDRNSQRDEWASRLAGATTLTAPQARALGIPLLRATLARHGAAAFPVRHVQRGNPAFDAGGVVNGVTLPPLLAPLREPDCYLPVIARVEGRMESINAWDEGAGISLGPIQFNVIRAALFRFLWRLRVEDPQLFRETLGTPLGWDMTWHGNHPDLVVTRGTTIDTLHGRAADADRVANATYLMRGVPGTGRRDPDYRRRVAACFRDAVVWPHVQQMIIDVSAWWLEQGLTQIRAAGIGPLSTTAPDRDTFALTALLLSAGVRYSGCLPQILNQLARWTTVADKLAHLGQALSSTNPPCPDHLRDRLVAQRRHAATVFGQVQRLIAQPARTEAVLSIELVPHEGASGFRNDWATGVLNTIGTPLAATGHSPEAWWEGMVAPIWLGRRFRNGIHRVLLQKLGAAEAYLRRKPAYASLSDSELGRAVGLTQNIGGARAGRASMHSFGLAVDIEYNANPWILGNPGAPISNESTRQTCNRAALLVGGRVIDTAPPFLSGLARNGTASAYDALRRLHDEFVAYLGIANDAAAARAHVDRNRGLAGVLKAGEPVDVAATRWAQQAQSDLERMRLAGSNFAPNRDPRRGFLSMPKDLVVALRDGGGLAWGAIDFGPQSGDIMHFDARRDGVGQAILNGIRAARRSS